MTVQHPLQCTIRLCNALFEGNLPVLELIKQSVPTKVSSDTAIAGLMFLVAHEMAGMTSSYLIPLSKERLLDLATALAIYFKGKDISGSDLLQLSIKALEDPALKSLEKTSY